MAEISKNGPPTRSRCLSERQVVSAIQAAFKDRPLGAAFLVDGGRVILELGKRLGHSTDKSLLEFAKQCTEQEGEPGMAWRRDWFQGLSDEQA